MWKGFIAESKLFMGYPKCGRFYFWSMFPGALTRYIFAIAKDKVRHV